jgi:hypothetical protein
MRRVRALASPPLRVWLPLPRFSRPFTAAAAGVAPAGGAPPEHVLEAIARSTPGTSLYGQAARGVGTDYPYSLWWLDPAGAPYRFLLSAAGRVADVVTAAQAATGLPPWLVIVGSVALLRLSMVPLTALGMRWAARSHGAREDLAALGGALARARRAAAAEAAAAAAAGERGAPARAAAATLALARAWLRGVRAAHEKAGFRPGRVLALPLCVQAPASVLAVLGVRHVVHLGGPELETGGALWFTDLTVGDATGALPLLSFAIAYKAIDAVVRAFFRARVTHRPH